MNSAELLLQKIKEIFPSFKCNLQDLRNPTEEFVMNFYTNFLQEFEVDCANLHHMQPQQWNVLSQYPDAHAQFIYKANLLRCIRAFDIIPDFGMMDINSPTPNRTQHIVRALIDFYSLSDESVFTLTQRENIVKEKKMNMMLKVKEKEDRRNHLNELLIHSANIQTKEKQLEELILQLQQTAPELKTKKHLTKCIVDQANDKLKEKERVLQKLNKEMAAVTSKMKECTGMIVDSPSSFLTDMDSQRQKAQELEDLAEQKKNMVEEKTQKDLKLQTFLSLLQEKILVLNEVLKILKFLKEESRVLSDIGKDLKASQERLNELMSSLLALSNKKHAQQEALQDGHLQWKTLEPQLSQNVGSRMRELNKKRDAKNKMNNCLKEDTLLEEKKSELYAQFKKLMEQFVNANTAVENKRNQYFDEIEKRRDADKENLSNVIKAKNDAKTRKTKKDGK